VSSAGQGTGGFAALDLATLGKRLESIPAVAEKVGPDSARWKIREVGDGNLNLVFIVEGPKGAVVAKQALPYVRLVGESWPLPLKRSFFEYHALTRQERRAGAGTVPAIYHFDEAQALIVMEYLSPHVILRRRLIEGAILPKIGRDLGLFCARTLFRGSDLSMPTRERKQDVALFCDNVELCDITENLVFTDPYFEATLNRHTSPQLDPIVAELRADRDLKVEAQRLKHLFAAKAETLLHGDLHTGSVMVTETDTRVIDPEFAFYGPIAFDVGMLLANFWMSFFSQKGHEKNGDRAEMREWLLGVADEIWSVFRAESGRSSAPSSRICGAPSARASSTPAASSRIAATRLDPSRPSTRCSPKSGPTCLASPVSSATGASSASLTTPISRPSRTLNCAPAANARP